MSEDECALKSERIDESISESPIAREECSLGEKRGDRLSRLTLWFYRSADPSSIGIFRLLFGLLMIHDLMNERYLSSIFTLLVDTRFKIQETLYKYHLGKTSERGMEFTPT